ncbi:lipoprotein [Streptomyces spinoverrucosus]|uniref:Lipoprotein n=1 Tax=Streptomyces spinoverrucosus TaxID=284043 RepID=A0A4Y3VXK0_9ACTN|nr:Ig-like domain-containing protein [Streptomyces spinoverrucosus]GEC10501.1 lipoprotein [Streptomyces spinoverrucosus]
MRKFPPVLRAVTAAAAVLTGAMTGHVAAAAVQPAMPAPEHNVAVTGSVGAPASAAKITIMPGGGAAGTSITKGAEVSVSGAKLTSVVLTSLPSGTHSVGTASPGGTLRDADTAPARGTAPTVKATAEEARGRTVAEAASFATVDAGHSFIGSVTPKDGSRVGVGMPVSITFDKPITDKEAVQSHITVVSSSGQRAVGHWFGASRLDLRPRTYWKPGSDITVRLALDGVRGAKGITGVQNKTVRFHVGRSQISVVDVRRKTMTVIRDGKRIKTLPLSAGAAATPTYNGQMVISQKEQQMRMRGDTVGFTDKDGKPAYDIPDVPHALRLSTSGTFLHGNYWADKRVFGSANTSHGCIGLNDVQGGKDPSTPAAWFFDQSLIGDVVIVKNSGGTTIKPDNGLGDWNMPWNTWKAGSAA